MKLGFMHLVLTTREREMMVWGFRGNFGEERRDCHGESEREGERLRFSFGGRESRLEREGRGFEVLFWGRESAD